MTKPVFFAMIRVILALISKRGYSPGICLLIRGREREVAMKGNISILYHNLPDGHQVAVHRHPALELVYIGQGSGFYTFADMEIPVMIGDAFVIPSRVPHGCRMGCGSEYYSCKFVPEEMGEMAEYIKIRADAEGSGQTDSSAATVPWVNLLISLSLRENAENERLKKTPDAQYIPRIVHLTPETAAEMDRMLRYLRQEEALPLYDSGYMKRALLQMVLVMYKRAENDLPQNIPKQDGSKRQLITEALKYMETYFADPLTLREIAGQVSLSEGYFRSIFKQATGMTPLDYLNRYRVIRAMRFIQQDGLPIAEAAAKVGIMDSNYFTRLFKKIIGYAPSFFKRIPSVEDE